MNDLEQGEGYGFEQGKLTLSDGENDFGIVEKPEDDEEKDKAATTIQAAWRGFVVRKNIDNKRRPVSPPGCRTF